MSRGYGFVQYESEDAAKQAIERVNGQEIGGRQVYVGPFIKRDKHEARNRPGTAALCETPAPPCIAFPQITNPKLTM